ncbi:MAG: rhodanese-like domain-containing protein [Thermodesulfobacteriota bacterium]
MAKAPRMTQEEFKGRFDAGEDIVVLDVRNPSDYAASGERIPGAIRIPVEELEARTGELDPDREVVAYCT